MNRSAKYMIMLASCLLTFSIEVDAQEIKTTLNLLESVSISEGKIYLADIVDLSDLNEELIQKLETVIVGSAPLPGRSRRVMKSLILTRLKIENLEDKVTLSGEDGVEVVREYNSISGSMITELVKQYAHDNFTSEVKEVRIEVLNTPNDIIIPSFNASINFKIPNGIIKPGRSVIHVIVSSESGYSRRIPITINVRTFEDVLISTHQLYRNSELKAEDVKVELRETTKAGSHKFITSREDVKSMRLVRGVSMNRILRFEMFRIPPLISRGTQLDLMIITKNLVIRTKGLAREEGQLNDYIEVQPLPYGKRIRAKIIDKMTVVAEL